MMTKPIAIQCQTLEKTYAAAAGPVRALRGVELSVPAGELFMLVGPSGCGKTTLLSIVAGILDADQGECVVQGTSWKALAPAEKAKFRAATIGFVFQQFHLIPTIPLVDNVAVPLLLLGKTRKESLERAREKLELVGLGERVQDLPKSLSGGQQQRVAIARALVHEPPLIVCDEPTSALDHKTGQQVVELLRGLAGESRRTLLVVTHDHRILPYADRIAEMDDGRIVRMERQKWEGREVPNA